jgi:hypothetical protein
MEEEEKEEERKKKRDTIHQNDIQTPLKAVCKNFYANL